MADHRDWLCTLRTWKGWEDIAGEQQNKDEVEKLLTKTSTGKTIEKNRDSVLVQKDEWRLIFTTKCKENT